MKTLMLSFLLISYTLFAQAQSLSELSKQAQEQNKELLLIFTGSDWCRACIILDKTILSSDEFKSYSDDNLIIMHVDFPRSKKNRLSKEMQKRNDMLAGKYNKEGQFPLLVFLNDDLKPIAKTAYKKLSPPEYIKHLEALVKKNN